MIPNDIIFVTPAAANGLSPTQRNLDLAWQFMFPHRASSRCRAPVAEYPRVMRALEASGIQQACQQRVVPGTRPQLRLNPPNADGMSSARKAAARQPGGQIRSSQSVPGGRHVRKVGEHPGHLPGCDLTATCRPVTSAAPDRKTLCDAGQQARALQ